MDKGEPPTMIRWFRDTRGFVQTAINPSQTTQNYVSWELFENHFIRVSHPDQLGTEV